MSMWWLSVKPGCDRTRDYLYSRMYEMDGRNEVGTLILVAEVCDAQESSKLQTPNTQAQDVNTATGGSRISFISVFISLKYTPAEDGELFSCLSVVAGSAGKASNTG